MINQTLIWPIDMAAFAKIAGHRAPKLLPELIPIYLEDSELLITWMAEALQAGQATKLQQAAHRLKGNSVSLGVLTIADLADKLESLGKGKMLTTAVELFAELSEEYEKVKAAMLDMVSGLE